MACKFWSDGTVQIIFLEYGIIQEGGAMGMRVGDMILCNTSLETHLWHPCAKWPFQLGSVV